MKMNTINEKNIYEILTELFSFRTLKRRENIKDLNKIYDLLEKPCKNSKIIHIAGTNGKGSTASFLENIFISKGYNVCKFTSPHILKYNERIVFNKEMIEDEKIIYYYYFITDILKKYKFNLNFFEITFFIALLYFNEKKPDFIILETGLGGRLDATNTINSDISIITNISFDHTDILGDTLQKIAFEKAGIIKNNSLCIYSQNCPELINEINKRTDKSINVLNEYSNLKIELDKDNLKTVVTINENKFILPLFGKFQGYNFLLAYKVSKIYDIEDSIIQKGLDNVYWPARFEFFQKNPPVILDAAHNDDSIQKLSENLKELYKKNEVIFITSFLKTKDFSSVFSKLEEISDKIFITSLKEVVYGLSSNEIKEKMLNLNIPTENVTFEDNILIAYKEGLKIIKRNPSYKAIVICGSFYEISKFKMLISKST
ncbi:MAG: bifunctional folylpolyglutamate synthase/dihydrofolate synthase [Leptotrichiaceae bacterium]|nr:bifunctional folylpolyglutamate synthase/dihydrofolate synthase [Leptotrichiaceae bacterium]MBP7100189.1 bifunctional folylpolyglutamate synthase/dihydrofolate synthase [Leptotrichiaceae bacterium]MBP7725645.1 bifunctional folylpolyglutamate synthase/dihydrofolate synthase [Leptotrichiaceae bacterium]MBP9630011.1 bifunctional folylpolyglutamate synthase/dihydrofolate synthase [Leptotrichiaceae bacterium]